MVDDWKTEQDRQYTHNIILKHVSATTVAVEKQQVLRNMSVCVALVIQHVLRMRHFVTVVCPALLYFSTLSHKWHDFQKNVTENKMCNLSFPTKFV